VSKRESQARRLDEGVARSVCMVWSRLNPNLSNFVQARAFRLLILSIFRGQYPASSRQALRVPSIQNLNVLS
jgi:hypothetical protein